MTEVFTDLICRPPRRRYTLKELGPVDFCLGEDRLLCSRRDLVLSNRQGAKLECSHYIPWWIKEREGGNRKKQGPHNNLPPKTPCVVYLHGNAGCRLDADDLVDEYLGRGISLFTFDFGGSGVSGGNYVTLGHMERSDLECVLDYLGQREWVSCIALYGRSMGAATALLVASSDRYYHTIAGMVLDSCYTSVRSVIREIAQGYVGKAQLLPVSTVVESTIDALRDAVQQRAGFDFDSLEVVSKARHCQAPVLIAHADGDELVAQRHSVQIMQEYGGPKTSYVFPGNHNSIRPGCFGPRAADFLVECFRKKLLEDGGHRSSLSLVMLPKRASGMLARLIMAMLALAAVWALAAVVEHGAMAVWGRAFKAREPPPRERWGARFLARN